MAAFLMISSDQKGFSADGALNRMREQTLSEPRHFVIGRWDLYLFGKKNGAYSNFRESEDNSIFVCGSLFFPGMTYDETLDSLISNLENDRENQPRPRGIFFLLKSKTGVLSFETDDGGLYNIFHTSDGNVISNSFLAICSGLSSLTLNRSVLLENVITGSVIGAETTFNEILRFDNQNPFCFSNIEFTPRPGRYEYPGFSSKEDSLAAQIDVLDDYFKGIAPFIEQTGLDCGITGGYDSRLLYALVKRHFNPETTQFHSFLRKIPDSDYLIGRQVCEAGGSHFIPAQVKESFDHSEEEFSALLYQSMLFNDGQIRTHAFWHEEINTADFRRTVTGEKDSAFSGIGGEQYRNSERMVLRYRRLDKWVNYALIGRYAGECFTEKKIREELVASLSSKISERLDLDRKKAIDLLVLKRYMNEIYIPANRGVRCNNENKISFFFMPFADAEIAHTAYGAVPFLGANLDYEGDMIAMLDETIASLPSGYGYSFDRGEPFSRSLMYVFLENALPWKLNDRAYRLFSSRQTDYWRELQSKRETLDKLFNIFSDFAFPVDPHVLLASKDLGPLIFAAGYLLHFFKDKIKQ